MTAPNISTTSRPAWVSVDLATIRENTDSVRRWVGANTDVFSVVKANAYGHGLEPVARACLQAGAAGLAVAIPEEAIALREAGITGRILVMGACEPAAAADILRYDLETTVSTRELLLSLSDRARRLGRPARVHIKVDSGMGRVGVLPEEAPAFFEAVAAQGSVRWIGLMTHFATADEDDLAFTHEQWRRFKEVVNVAAACRRDPEPLLVHAANSAGAARLPELLADLPPGTRPAVRAGLLTYGVPPSAGPCPDIRPALSLRARITQARTVPAGTSVSYGATFTTARPSRLAVVPLGYADGYSRANSGRAQVLLRGRRIPVVGRVCMDQFVVDATDTGADAGDEVVLLGEQGDDRITVLELAEWGSTIHHEVLSRLSVRLPRVYTG